MTAADLEEFGAGVRLGYEIGFEDGRQAEVRMQVASIAPSVELVRRLGPSYAELLRIRADALAAHPALSAAEIRERTAASWAAFERRHCRGAA